MDSSRFLIINADDLGYSSEVNRGIFAAYEKGVVTDSSILIKRPFAREAIEIIKKDSRCPVGIHIDLDPLLGWESPGKEQLPRDELLQVMNDPSFAKKVKKEIDEQIEAFLDTGLIPSHVDSHHHVHGFPQIFNPLIEAMDGHGIKAIRFSKKGYFLMGRDEIPLAAETAQWMEEMLRKKGMVYPQQLIDPLFPFSLQGLPPGVSELMVHPSTGGDQWRQNDLKMLLDPHFMTTLQEEGIKLISFSELEASLCALT
jgi:predicted glycoside hydrolase/deacetylase ChbG (UPF0249 family)